MYRDRVTGKIVSKEEFMESRKDPRAKAKEEKVWTEGVGEGGKTDWWLLEACCKCCIRYDMESNWWLFDEWPGSLLVSVGCQVNLQEADQYSMVVW